METKQHATTQPMAHWRNQRGNLKIPRSKDKTKPMECSKSSSKRQVYSNTSPSQETGNISYKQSHLTPKQLEKKEQMKSKMSRRKEIINIRAEINKMAVPLWHIGLRIQYCHCSCSGCCCGVGSLPGQGTSASYEEAPCPLKRKKSFKNGELFLWLSRLRIHHSLCEDAG